MKTRGSRFRRYLVTGVVTVIPLWITWVVFKFSFDQLSRFGMPWVQALAKYIRPDAPAIAQFLLEDWFQYLLAVVLTLGSIVLLGWITTRVIGRRIVQAVEAFLNRVPIVRSVYGSSRKLISALQRKPDGTQRVVLIAFPTNEMRTVGLVTRTLTDTETGEELAAVYVPTTPNPTSGYLEIVPVADLVATDWTMDEAMTFIVSGGAVAPDTMRFGAKRS